MTKLHSLLNFNQIRFMDQINQTSEHTAMVDFAIDDALCLSVSENLSPPVARVWAHENTISLGIPDSRLPYLMDGVSYLQSKDYQVIVRNSGGLAVMLDHGVLNFSFVFPDAKKLSIHEGYEAMVDFIKSLFQEEKARIEAFEVIGSYCPGDYDLSINGKKFAGISQRRVKNGTAVQIYLCVEGSGSKRAELIRDFYSRALKNEQGTFEYPKVKPETMASLSELLEKELTVSDVRNRIWEKLQAISNEITTQPLHSVELDWFEKRLEHMIERNEKALG